MNAIRLDEPRIDISMLDKIDYVPPSKRKTYLRKLLE